MRDESKLAIDRWENEGGRSLLQKAPPSFGDTEATEAVRNASGRPPHPHRRQRVPEKRRQTRGHAGRTA